MRMVVVLRDVYDLAHEEIARELGISQTAAKVRLHRARRRLREQLFAPAGAAGGLEPHEAASAGLRRSRGRGRGQLAPEPAVRRWRSRRARSRRGGQPCSRGLNRCFSPAVRPGGFARVPRLAQAGSSCASVSCAEVALVLPSILDGGSPRPTKSSSSTLAPACAARPSSPGTASCCGCSTSCGPTGSNHHLERWPTCSARSRQAAQRRVIRSVLTGRRLVYAGAFAAPAAAIVARDRRAPWPPAEGPARGAIVMPTRGDRCSVSGGPRPRPGGQ